MKKELIHWDSMMNVDEFITANYSQYEEKYAEDMNGKAPESNDDIFNKYIEEITELMTDLYVEHIS